MRKKIIKIIIILAIPLMLIAFFVSKNNQAAVSNILKGKSVTVYRSKGYGYCANYVTYLKRAGAQVEVKLTADKDIPAIRKQFSVSDELSSYHTARIDNYTVEGHMPIEAIEKLLTEKPGLAGIALPLMPAGSPACRAEKPKPSKFPISPPPAYRLSI